MYKSVAVSNHAAQFEIVRFAINLELHRLAIFAKHHLYDSFLIQWQSKYHIMVQYAVNGIVFCVVVICGNM